MIRRLALLPLLALTACGRPDDTAPEPAAPVPERFVATAAVDQAIDAAWVATFADPTLEVLVAEAWAANPDLVAAAARLDQARARAAQRGATRWPELSLEASGGRARSNVENPLTGEREAIYGNDYQLGLGVSWEADVWGRLAAAARSELAGAVAARADLVAAHQLLAAQVARAWYRVTHDQLQLALSEDFLDSARTTERLLAKRFADGRSPAVDLRAARAQAARAEVDVLEQRKALEASRRDLELLLGRYPAAAVAGAADLPTLADPIPVGVPAQLLLRRPDLRAAVARLRAADELVAVAEADLLPRLTLSASGGWRADDLGDLVRPESVIWNFVAGLFAPLFDAGRRRAVVDEREARTRELAAGYAAAALVALREVEQAVAIGVHIAHGLDAQRRAVDESAEVVVELRRRYGQGLVDGVILLGEQRAALTRRKEQLGLRLQALLNRIDLYLALGGNASGDQAAAVAAAAGERSLDEPQGDQP